MFSGWRQKVKGKTAVRQSEGVLDIPRSNQPETGWIEQIRREVTCGGKKVLSEKQGKR
jgi:hypothetical protein